MTEQWLAIEVLAAVAAGSALGGVARHLLGAALDRRSGSSLPMGTLVVNFSGAWMIGLLASVLVVPGPDGPSLAWSMLVIGFLGSYTTVSAFSLQTLVLVRSGKLTAAALNVGISLVGCPTAALLGFVVGGAAARWS